MLRKPKREQLPNWVGRTRITSSTNNWSRRILTWKSIFTVRSNQEVKPSKARRASLIPSLRGQGRIRTDNVQGQPLEVDEPANFRNSRSLMSRLTASTTMKKWDGHRTFSIEIASYRWESSWSQGRSILICVASRKKAVKKTSTINLSSGKLPRSKFRRTEGIDIATSLKSGTIQNRRS